MDIKHYYSSIAKQYSTLRPPIGPDVITALIKHRIEKEAQEIKVLDAGCGTGQFTKSLIGHGLRHVTLLDAAEGMINEAKHNLAEEIKMGFIDDIVQATLPTMPFQDKSFDVVIFSLVLDFLTVNSPTGRDFSGITKTMKEARRLLAQGGMIAISTLARRAVDDGIWFMDLLPETAVDRFRNKYPTITEWESIFNESRFQCTNKVGLLGPEVLGPWFSDAEGPIKKEWRNSVSLWKTLTDQELKVTEERIEYIMRTSSLEKYKIEHETSNEIGNINILICIPM